MVGHGKAVNRPPPGSAASNAPKFAEGQVLIGFQSGATAQVTGALGQNFRAWVANGHLDLLDAVSLAEGGTTPPPPPPGGVDTTPPVFTNVDSGITNKGKGSFRIYWPTDEPPTSDAYSEGTWYCDSNLTTSHARNVTGAQRGATCDYTVKSTDAAGTRSPPTVCTRTDRNNGEPDGNLRPAFPYQ